MNLEVRSNSAGIGTVYLYFHFSMQKEASSLSHAVCTVSATGPCKSSEACSGPQLLRPRFPRSVFEFLGVPPWHSVPRIISPLKTSFYSQLLWARFTLLLPHSGHFTSAAIFSLHTCIVLPCIPKCTLLAPACVPMAPAPAPHKEAGGFQRLLRLNFRILPWKPAHLLTQSGHIVLSTSCPRKVSSQLFLGSLLR